MSKQTADPATAGKCESCSPSRRNRYYRDKRLHVADYILEQEYHIARRRLVNRAMLGWGVVWGFEINPETLTIKKGFALDPQGREVVACEDLKLGCGEDFLWLAPGPDGCGPAITEPPKEPEANAEQRPDHPPLYLLAAHYAEKRIEYVRIEDGCGSSRGEANQVCETVVYSLRPIPCCEAGLPDCRCPRCAGQDECACKEPEHAERQAAEAGQKQCVAPDRGNHRQLALWSLAPLQGFDICKPGMLESVGCLETDPCAGVPLACVTIGFHCGKPCVTGIVDSAHPRRLARSNEVLFDLIRGCDLTRIMNVGWKDWLPPGQKISLSDFRQMFEPPADPENSSFHRRKKPFGSVETHFTVEFTGPVREKTLTPDVFAMSLIQREHREDVDDIVRVPIVGLKPFPLTDGDPPGTTRGFTTFVEASFWKGELDPDEASGFEQETLIEIEIRTDWILDCNGQEVAGGGRYIPSTGCTPGGRFLSNFIVIPENQTQQEA